MSAWRKDQPLAYPKECWNTVTSDPNIQQAILKDGPIEAGSMGIEYVTRVGTLTAAASVTEGHDVTSNNNEELSNTQRLVMGGFLLLGMKVMERTVTKGYEGYQKAFIRNGKSSVVSEP